MKSTSSEKFANLKFKKCCHVLCHSNNTPHSRQGFTCTFVAFKKTFNDNFGSKKCCLIARWDFKAVVLTVGSMATHQTLIIDLIYLNVLLWPSIMHTDVK